MRKFLPSYASIIIYGKKTDIKEIKKDMEELLKYIYNFKESGNISSVKIE